MVRNTQAVTPPILGGTLRVVDLCCGCGGFSLGFQNAGMDVVAAYDKWDKVINVYRANFSHPVFEYDLNDSAIIDHIKGYTPDIIIGGTPCQDFSPAGKRKQGARADLTLRFGDVVVAVLPKIFVMENVPNIKKAGVAILAQVCALFKAAGYGLTFRVLDASKCGVPQARKRFFLVGMLGAQDDFIGADLDAGFSDKQMTVRDYLGNSLNINHYYMHSRSSVRRSVYSIDEPSRTVYGTYSDMPASYVMRKGDTADVASGLVRALTPKERSYLQTFPESFKFEGTKADINQMVSNAVPVKLAEYIARCIIDYEARTSSNKSRASTQAAINAALVRIIKSAPGTLRTAVHDAERDRAKNKAGKFPNLALCKLSAFCKFHGHAVEWFVVGKEYDIVFSSKVFTFTPDNPALPTHTIRAGTGYGTVDGAYTELPSDVDAIFPDYTLYPEYDAAIGFTTRGCVNRCKFCVVPVKEGALRPYAEWRHIVRDGIKRLVLMDNNILACAYGIQQLEELADAGIEVDCNQGMDARLVTPEIADILARVKWLAKKKGDTKYIRFSCDSTAQLPAIKRTVKLLGERGIRPYRIFVYLLVDSTANAERRVRELHKLGVYIKAQAYRPLDGTPPTPEQERFTKYVNGWSYKKFTWDEFCEWHGLSDEAGWDAVRRREKAGGSRD